MTTSNIPVGIDYTSRDYYALREELLTRVRTAVNSGATDQQHWTGTDPADFGVALVEAFAYMGDILNYYIDRVANESYLPTASQRQNVINLAQLYGYRPAGYRSAFTTVRFTNNSSTAVSLPAGTQVSGKAVVDDTVQTLIFTTLEAVTVPAAVSGAGGVVSVGATHSESIALRPENVANGTNDIAGEFVAASTGQPSQSYPLVSDQIVDGSIQVWVQNGDMYEPWQQVIHLADYGPSDAVYSITLDANNTSYINFGDGVSGVVPAPLANIKAVYDIGGGEIGNISDSVLDTVYRVPGLTSTQTSHLNDYLDVKNTTVGIGGVSPESTSSIRTNAPKLLTAVSRAVSLKDYENLVLAIPNVGKAKADATNPTSVSLFVSPQRNDNTSDAFPGYAPNNSTLQAEWTNLQTAVKSYLSDKTQVGVTVTVSPPTYVPVTVNVVYSKLPQYTSSSVEAALKLKLLTDFSYNNISFGDVITPEDIEFRLKQVDGVRVAQVTSLTRASGNNYGVNALIGSPNEIFVFQEIHLTVTEASSDATLSALAVPSGTTLSPAFSSSFYTYNLSGVSTSTVTLTPTATNSGATVTINGNPVSTPVDTPVGTTVIPIVVAASDHSSFKVYTVIVTR